MCNNVARRFQLAFFFEKKMNRKDRECAGGFCGFDRIDVNYGSKKLIMQKVINIDKEILGGTPVFMGTRVPIKNLFDYLEDGETITEFLDDFPTVKSEQVGRVLQISQHLLINVTEVAYENFCLN